jgi:hypothetical protein
VDASAAMSQKLSVSAESSFSASGQEPYDLSAWLGGYASQGDNIGLVQTFLNSSDSSSGTATLGPVTPAERAGNTELLPESATGLAPSGTTSVQFTLTFTGEAGSFNDIGMTLGS